MSSAEQICNDIADTKFGDEELRRIERSIIELRNKVMTPIIRGVEVRLNEMMKPRWLIGLPGFVIKVNRETVVVKVDQDTTFRVPRNAITLTHDSAQRP